MLNQELTLINDIFGKQNRSDGWSRHKYLKKQHIMPRSKETPKPQKEKRLMSHLKKRYIIPTVKPGGGIVMVWAVLLPQNLEVSQ